MTISIHAPREGSDALNGHFPLHLRISIHAPREGSDRGGDGDAGGDGMNFYPRSP